jgi:hypothetical protein
MIQTLLHITPFAFVLLCLAGYRITRLFVADTFPLFSRPRNWLHSRFPPTGAFMDGGPQDFPPHVRHATYQNTGVGRESRWFINDGHWLGDLTSCAWCTGWWVSLIGAVMYGLFPHFAVVASIPWAVSAVVGLISSKEG